MKFAFLTAKLVIFCFIGLYGADALAADQVNQLNSVGNLKTPQTLTRANGRFINLSKQPISIAPGMRTLPKTTVLSKPAKTSFVNNSKSVPAGIVPGVPSSTIPANDQIILQSRDINSLGLQWQSLSDYLTVPKGCDQIPFNLIFTNGPLSRFKDIRVTLAGKTIATLKDFNGQSTLDKSLKGALAVGQNLLIVQVIGPAGAKLKWKFVTAKIIVTKVNPDSFAPSDKITIEGRNFSDIPNVTKVLIGEKPATVLSAKNNSLQIKPPTGLLGGKTNLVVMIGNQKSAPVSVTIKGAPEIEGVNMVSTAPGQPLTITGKGFSSVMSENEVTIGPYQAEITSVSPTSIEVTVPMALDSMSPVWDLPIKVKTNGMESTDVTNSGKINIQSRVF